MSLQPLPPSLPPEKSHARQEQSYLGYLRLRVLRTWQEVKSHSSRPREVIKSTSSLALGMLITWKWLGKDVFKEQLLAWITWSFVAGLVVRSAEVIIDFIQSSYLLHKDSEKKISDSENKIAELRGDLKAAEARQLAQVSALQEALEEAKAQEPTPEPNLVFREPRVLTMGRNQQGQYYEITQSLPAIDEGSALLGLEYSDVIPSLPFAVIEIKNDADVSNRVVSSADVRATISFEETGSKQSLSIPNVAWAEEKNIYVHFRLGDLKTLMVAYKSDDKVNAVEVKGSQRRRGMGVHFERLPVELTGNEYRVEVQLFANRPRKMVGKREYRLITRPELKIKVVDAEKEKMERLIAFSNEGNLLHARCFHGNSTTDIENEIIDWQSNVSTFLEENFGRATKAMFMNAVVVSATLPGRSSRDRYLIGWTTVRTQKLNQIIEEQRNR